MNILGMGPTEILLIVVLALIVFGPARLPEIMGQVGRAIADFRRATSQLSDEFNRTIQAELQETRAVVDDTKSAVTGVHTSINAALTGATAAPVHTATPVEALPVSTNGSNGTNATNGTAVTGEPKPPLADTAQWSWETQTPAPSSPAAVTAAPVVPAVAPLAPPSPPVPARRPKVRDELVPPY